MLPQLHFPSGMGSWSLCLALLKGRGLALASPNDFPGFWGAVNKLLSPPYVHSSTTGDPGQ